MAGQALQLRVRALQGPHRAGHLRQRRPVLLLRLPRPRHCCRPSRPHQVVVVVIMDNDNSGGNGFNSRVNVDDSGSDDYNGEVIYGEEEWR